MFFELQHASLRRLSASHVPVTESFSDRVYLACRIPELPGGFHAKYF